RVDDGRLHAAVVTQRADHTEPVVERYERGERGEIGHDRTPSDSVTSSHHGDPRTRPTSPVHENPDEFRGSRRSSWEQLGRGGRRCTTCGRRCGPSRTWWPRWTTPSSVRPHPAPTTRSATCST